ncbi:MAG: lysostaphin resistance A-like protein, partial [Promethearchaeota archaeon]
GLFIAMLYIIFTIIGEVLSVIISNYLLESDILLFHVARFIILLIVNSFVWLWLIPMFFQLTEGKITMSKYLEIIKLDKKSFSPIGRNIFFALFCVVIFCLGLFLASFLTGEYVFELERIFGLPKDMGDQKVFTFIFNLIPGIFEEIAFRGVILVLLLRKYSERTSIGLSGLIFGLGHFINFLIFGDFWSSIAQIISGILIGWFFAYLTLKSGSLLPSIIIHYLYNALSIVFIVFGESDPITYFLLKIIFASIIPILINVYSSRYFVDKKKNGTKNELESP